jgi:hypothetical protein
MLTKKKVAKKKIVNSENNLKKGDFPLLTILTSSYINFVF